MHVSSSCLALTKRMTRRCSGHGGLSKGPIQRKTPKKSGKTGYHMHQVIETRSGAAGLRLAVRDQIADRVASIEIGLPLTLEKPGDTP
jgi:hypothetical protein